MYIYILLNFYLTPVICLEGNFHLPDKENALKKAKQYQDMMNMSTDAIRDQLVSEHGEKFTAEEAEYAIEHLE